MAKKVLSTDRAFKLGVLYLQSLDALEATSSSWTMVGLREVKRFLGLLNHRCPLCQENMHYYIILCRAKNTCGKPVGKSQPLPILTKDGFLPGMLIPFGELQFGVCYNNHEVARIDVNHGGGDGFNGFLIHQFKGNRIVRIVCP